MYSVLLIHLPIQLIIKLTILKNIVYFSHLICYYLCGGFHYNYFAGSYPHQCECVHTKPAVNVDNIDLTIPFNRSNS